MGAAGATTFDAKVSHSIRDSRQLQASTNCKANKNIKAQSKTGVQKCKGKRGWFTCDGVALGARHHDDSCGVAARVSEALRKRSEGQK